VRVRYRIGKEFILLVRRSEMVSVIMSFTLRCFIFAYQGELDPRKRCCAARSFFKLELKRKTFGARFGNPASLAGVPIFF